MTELSALDYRSSIVTFARTAQNLLNEANIHTPGQAMASDELLHGLASGFPRLHNLAVELNCFWGASVPLYGGEPVSPVDRAAAFFKLSGLINSFLDDSPHFRNVQPLLQQQDLNIADDIRAGLGMIDTRTNHYEKLKAADWLRSSFSLFKLKLPIYREQQQENSEHKICAGRLPELLAFSLSTNENRPNLTAITEALCGTYQQLGNFQRMPSRREIERHLLNNLKQQGCLKVVEKSLPPAPDVMEQFSKLVFENCNFNFYLSDTERMLEMSRAQLSYAADCSQTRDIIFRQLREEGFPAVEPLYFSPAKTENKPVSPKIDLLKIEAALENFRRNRSWINAYENAVVDRELVSDYQKLIKGWVNVTADFCGEACEQSCILLDQETIPEKERKSIGKKLLQQADTVVHVCNALYGAVGLNFNDSGLGLEHLEVMKQQEDLNIDQLRMLNRLFNSFGQYYAAGPQEFDLKETDDIGADFAGRLAALPPSLPRYNMLFYSDRAMADIFAGQRKEIRDLERLCAHDLQEVGKPLFNQLQADVGDYCSANLDHYALSRNIDFNVCRFYLLPRYEEKEISGSVSRAQLSRNLVGLEGCAPDERQIIASLAERHFQRLLPLHRQAIDRCIYPSDRFMNHFDNYCDLKDQNIFYRHNLQLVKQVLPAAKEHHRLYHQLNASGLITPQPGLSRMLVASRCHRGN